MKCIVIDDEPFAVEGMKLNIEKIDFLELIGTFNDVVEANAFMKNNSVDLLFMDIEMPDITGLEYLAMLEKKPLTILATAYPQYAMDGFDLGVVDYVTKPIDFLRFLKAVNRAKEVYDLENKSSFQLQNNPNEDFFFIRSNWKHIKIKYEEVKYIKGLKDYVIIYVDKEHHMTAVNLKTMLLQLPTSNFIRINKSFIVNIYHVDSVYQDIVTVGEEELVLSTIYKDEFYEKCVNSKLIKRYFK